MPNTNARNAENNSEDDDEIPTLAELWERAEKLDEEVRRHLESLAAQQNQGSR
jgi:hypothetical protein